MAIKRTTLNFFQLSPKEHTVFSMSEISSFLNGLEFTEFKIDETSRRVLIIKDNIIRNGMNCLTGAIYKIKMSDIPSSMNKETLALEQLPLDEISGLAEVTCFIIDPQINLLVIESGTGVSEQALCKYIERNTEIPALGASYLINPGQVEEFYRMGSVYSFEAKMAKVNNGSLFSEGKKLAINQILNSADDTNTDVLTYKLEVTPKTKKEKGSLNKATIARFIQNFLKFKESEEVEKLKITGSGDDDERPIVLELIKQRMHDKIEYEASERTKSYDIRVRISKMEDTYTRHRESLVRAYGF